MPTRNVKRCQRAEGAQDKGHTFERQGIQRRPCLPRPWRTWVGKYGNQVEREVDLLVSVTTQGCHFTPPQMRSLKFCLLKRWGSKLYCGDGPMKASVIAPAERLQGCF